jgi:SAM-dependent methyltransferase
LRDIGATTVLDVGAAAGFILAGMQQSGCVGMGIEPNASMVSFAARQLDLDICQSTLEAFEHDEQFDAVSLLQVVDHFEDPRRAFERVRALTKPGGWCLVEFGNRASITARLLGTSWHEYAPPSVQRVFSLRALVRLIADYGFTLRSSGHPRKYLRADHALSLLRYTSSPWIDTLLARMTRLVPAGIKIRYPGDDITWALFERDDSR